MADVFIFDAVRTPRGRGKAGKGGLSGLHPQEVLAQTLNHMAARIHLDKHLDELIANYGTLTYGILFLIIFCETGLVVTPVLPGDSLLFAVGAFAARGSFNLPLILGLLIAAAILGDTVNYSVGRYLSDKLVNGRLSWLIKQSYLDQTNKWLSEMDEFKDLAGDLPSTEARLGYETPRPPVLVPGAPAQRGRVRSYGANNVERPRG